MDNQIKLLITEDAAEFDRENLERSLTRYVYETFKRIIYFYICVLPGSKLECSGQENGFRASAEGPGAYGCDRGRICRDRG